MESEKRAVRDFEGPKKSGSKKTSSVPFFPMPSGTENSKLDPLNYFFPKSNENQKIEIPEPNIPGSELEITAEKDRKIPPTTKPIASDKTPVGIVEPNTEELQTIKNMILILQLELQEERSKREILEEKIKKFEVNLAQPTHGRRDSEWHTSEIPGQDSVSDNAGPNSDMSRNHNLLRPLYTIKSVDDKIGDLSSEFDMKFRNFDKSLSEMRSILANNLGCGLKLGKKIEAGPCEHTDYNRFVYKKLERGIFPRQISLKSLLVKSLGELLNKPWSEKTEIESSLDQYYLDNLPPAFLEQDERENEDQALADKKLSQLFNNPLTT
jgi:hypothetical protein